MAIKLVREREPGPGTLGKPELYALAIGQVIGAGVITLVVPAIKMTGYSAWLAYFAAIIMGFFMILPTVFVSSTVRLGGGNYSMLAGLAGPNISGIYAFMYLTQCLSLSLFGSSAAAYLGDIIPALSSHGARIVIGAALLTFFYVINLMGIDVMASAQKLMTWLLIAALLLFTIFGLAKMKLPIFDFSDPEFLTQGWGVNFSDGQISGGFVGAMLLFVYSTQGYYMTTAYGGSSKNAKRDIPFVLLMCVPTLCVLYVGVAMAGVGSTTLAEYGESTTLVVAAQNLFPTVLFYFFIIGGPIMALLSTLNSSFAYNSITIGTACDDGWLPKTFGKKNAKGGRVWISDLYVYHWYDSHSLRLVHHNHHQYGAAHRSLLCLPELQGIYQSAEALSRCLGKIQVPHPQRPLLFPLLRLAGRLLCNALEVLPVHEPRPGGHQHHGYRRFGYPGLCTRQERERRDPYLHLVRRSRGGCEGRGNHGCFHEQEVRNKLLEGGLSV